MRRILYGSVFEEISGERIALSYSKRHPETRMSSGCLFNVLEIYRFYRRPNRASSRRRLLAFAFKNGWETDPSLAYQETSEKRA